MMWGGGEREINRDGEMLAAYPTLEGSNMNPLYSLCPFDLQQQQQQYLFGTSHHN